MRLWHYHIAGSKSHHDEAFDLNVRFDHSDRKKSPGNQFNHFVTFDAKNILLREDPLRAMEHFYVFSAERKQQVS